MNEEKKGTGSADLIRQLESTDASTVVKALHKLARGGSVRDLPSVIRAMSRVTDQSLLEHFTSFLSNIRSKEAPEVIVGFLTDPSCSAIRAELTRSCWESQLDYSPYLILFTRLFITSDFMEAVEAFSVIESSCIEREVSNPVISEIISLVNSSIPDQTEEKKRLSAELIRALSPYLSA